MAQQIKKSTLGRTTTGGVTQTKALADVSVQDGSRQSGGLLLNLMSGDDGRDLNAEEVLRAYHSSPPLHMAVSAIARTVGEVSYLWEDEREPDNFSLTRPNRWHQSSEFFGLVAAYLKLTGKVYLIKADTAEGIELLPIPKHLVEDPDTRSGKWLLKDGAISLSKTEYARDELIILQDPSLLDPYMDGRGSGQVVGSDIDIDEAGAQHTAAYLENHARPDSIVSINGASDAMLKKFETSMRQKHGGPKNSGKVEAFADTEIDVQTLMSPFDDLGVEGLRRQSAQVVRQVFGVPPSIVGDVSDTNRATAETEGYLFKKNVIKPLVDKIVEAMNAQFVKVDLGEGLQIITGAVVPDDRRFKSQLYEDIPQAFTVDEARALAGLEPMDDGGERTLSEAAPRQMDAGAKAAKSCCGPRKKKRPSDSIRSASRPTTSASSAPSMPSTRRI